MKPSTLRKIGVFGGLLVILLASAEFSRSYTSGDPKWNYVVLISGMSILLLYTLFWKRRS